MSESGIVFYIVAFFLYLLSFIFYRVIKYFSAGKQTKFKLGSVVQCCFTYARYDWLLVQTWKTIKMVLLRVRTCLLSFKDKTFLRRKIPSGYVPNQF